MTYKSSINTSLSSEEKEQRQKQYLVLLPFREFNEKLLKSDRNYETFDDVKFLTLAKLNELHNKIIRQRDDVGCGGDDSKVKGVITAAVAVCGFLDKDCDKKSRCLMICCKYVQQLMHEPYNDGNKRTASAVLEYFFTINEITPKHNIDTERLASIVNSMIFNEKDDLFLSQVESGKILTLEPKSPSYQLPISFLSSDAKIVREGIKQFIATHECRDAYIYIYGENTLSCANIRAGEIKGIQRIEPKTGVDEKKVIQSIIRMMKQNPLQVEVDIKTLENIYLETNQIRREVLSEVAVKAFDAGIIHQKHQEAEGDKFDFREAMEDNFKYQIALLYGIDYKPQYDLSPSYAHFGMWVMRKQIEYKQLKDKPVDEEFEQWFAQTKKQEEEQKTPKPKQTEEINSFHFNTKSLKDTMSLKEDQDNSGIEEHNQQSEMMIGEHLMSTNIQPAVFLEIDKIDTSIIKKAKQEALLDEDMHDEHTESFQSAFEQQNNSKMQ